MEPIHSAVASPHQAIFLTADWRYLVMLNYEVDLAILMPRLPAGTVLDLWNDRALVSIVGFRFLNARVRGIQMPCHVNFDEVNLRFYVRRELPDGANRRGVAFIRELVPRQIIALIARFAYNEPYQSCRMRSKAPERPTDSPGRVSYEWLTSTGWQHVAATAVDAPVVPLPGSEAEFITEHFWGYTRQRNGRTIEYKVDHPSWRVWNVERPELAAAASTFYGPVFADALTARPRSAFIAEGSAIQVSAPNKL